MLADELRQLLKSIEPDVKAIEEYWQNSGFEKRYQDLAQEVNSENFWQHKDQIAISKEFQNLKDLKEDYDTATSLYKENVDLVELFSENEDELAKIKKDILMLTRQVAKFKLELLLQNQEDSKNCFMSINAGAGGTESQDWASMLLRMYLRFCEREGFKVDIMDYQDGEEAGVKSATLYIKGKNTYGFLKTEAGIHRLVRISPFDSNKRRHTSFAAVSVTPEAVEEKIEINDDDLRIDTYRAGGKGGQHVNKTDSAVRITHIPTNTVVQCQNERSQLQNKQTAMKMLMAKLVQKQKDEQHAKDASVKKDKIEWGSQIRSYVLHPYKMVKDHRTSLESPQPDDVLDGNIMPFIEKVLTTS